jgi:hypothetical protein
MFFHVLLKGKGQLLGRKAAEVGVDMGLRGLPLQLLVYAGIPPVQLRLVFVSFFQLRRLEKVLGDTCQSEGGLLVLQGLAREGSGV